MSRAYLVHVVEGFNLLLDVMAEAFRGTALILGLTFCYLFLWPLAVISIICKYEDGHE